MAATSDSITPSHTDEGSGDDISIPTEPSKQIPHVPSIPTTTTNPENATTSSFAQSLILSALAGVQNQVDNFGVDNGHLSFRVSPEGEVQLVALQRGTEVPLPSAESNPSVSDSSAVAASTVAESLIQLQEKEGHQKL